MLTGIDHIRVFVFIIISGNNRISFIVNRTGVRDFAFIITLDVCIQLQSFFSVGELLNMGNQCGIIACVRCFGDCKYVGSAFCLFILARYKEEGRYV